MEFEKIEWRISSGLTPYPEALTWMEERVRLISENKAPEVIWLLEHPPLYTAGTGAEVKELLTPDRFPVFTVGRGGKYTYHGPGQRIIYALLDLKKRFHPKSPDVRKFVFCLEEWIIQTLAQFEITAFRRDGRVGVWVEPLPYQEKKIAALGIRLKKWVSFYGIAVNISPDLEHFQGIIPCGLSHYGVTSFRDLGKTLSFSSFDEALKDQFPAMLSRLSGISFVNNVVETDRT